MCGIAGFIDPSLSAEEGAAHLQRMLGLIARLSEVSQRSIDQSVVELTFTARPEKSSAS